MEEIIVKEKEPEMLSLNGDFNRLIKTANEIQNNCVDHLVRSDQIVMDHNLRLNFNGHSVRMSDLAAGHLCGKLKVPSRYYNRLVDVDAYDLAATNINYWLQYGPKDLFLRQYKDQIRGILSGSYSVYDAPEILKTVSEVFNPNDFKLKGSFINEERLHLRLIENEMLDIDGEDLFAGITLDSSDVGRSGLQVRFFIYKQVCTNGLVIAQSSACLFKQKHIGITHDDFVEGLAAGLDTFYELKDKIVEQIIATSKIPVTDDIEDLIEEIKKSTNLSDDAVADVIDLMTNKYERTQWGLINGITEVAQRYTLERRIELETIAGNMLKAA